VLQNDSENKTRILVTHALHFLPSVDYIYTVVNGRVAESGTYAQLLENQGEFARLVTQFGAQQAEEKGDDEEREEDVTEAVPSSGAQGEKSPMVHGPGLMQAEERNTGAIAWSVYKEYLSAAHGGTTLLFLLFSLVLIQGATVVGSYWLVYWQERKWDRPQGFYVRGSIGLRGQRLNLY